MAARRYKLFNLAKTYNKNLTQSDVQGMASSVLLAGLAIPPYDAASSAQGDAAAELEHERSMRMASILGFNVVRHPPPGMALLLRPTLYRSYGQVPNYTACTWPPSSASTWYGTRDLAWPWC